MLSSLALFLSITAAPHGAAVPSTPQPAAVATCNVLAKSQIEAAVGRPLDVGTEEHSKFDSTCSYSGGDVAVTISIQHLTRALDLAAELGSLKASFPDATIREVKGIAEHAFALEIPGAGTQLHVLPQDREYFLVSVLGVGDGHNGFDAAAKIARALMHQR
jgi:hypothetical protein